MLYMALAVLAGILVSSQSSFNGMLYPFLGVLGVSFASNFLNAVTSFFFSLVYFHRPPKLKGLPVHASFGGLCALVVLGFSGYLVAHVGTAVTVCLSVSGQLFMSAVVDHFGLFGSEKIAFKKIRIPGFLCIIIGVFVINFAGGSAFSSVKNQWFLLLLLIFAIIIGCITVFARMFNYEASKYVGKLDGNFANSMMGAGAALVILLVTTGFRPPVSGILKAPAAGYLTGPFGTIACVLNSLCYAKLKVFHATIFLLIGQIATGIVMDLILLGSFPPGKLVGILIVCFGIFLDKKFTAKETA